MKEPNTMTTGFSPSNRESTCSLPWVSFSSKLIAVSPVTNPALSKFPLALGEQPLFRVVGSTGSLGPTTIGALDGAGSSVVGGVAVGIDVELQAMTGRASRLNIPIRRHNLALIMFTLV
ncbi:hypothetical protein ACFLYR_06170 [Chloroflexota bacterium]